MNNPFISQPLVSISCITYNHAPYIRQTLDSFLMQQTNFPFEVLIHDDCSTDGTDNIIREYAERYPDVIKPMYETENQYSQGKPAGSIVWNIPRAKGKYIAFCEGDDYWSDPLKLQRHVDFLEHNPEYGLIYGKAREFNNSIKKFTGITGGPTEDLNKLIIANTIPTPTTLFRKNFIDGYKNYGWGQQKYLMSDYPLWLYIGANSKIKFDNNICAVYRIICGSASHPSSLDKWIKFQECYTKIKFDFASVYVSQDKHILSAISNMHIKAILRQRTLYNKKLRDYLDKEINRLEYLSLNKCMLNLINRNIFFNSILKIYLINKNIYNKISNRLRNIQIKSCSL